MSLRKYVLPGLIGIAIIAVLAWAFRPQPITVDAVAVQRGVLQVSVEEEARTRVIDRFVISAPVAGYLQRITLRAGHPVQAGATLAAIEPMQPEVLNPRARAAAEGRVAAARSSLRAAEENVDVAQAGAELAAAEHDRMSRLRQAGQVSVEQADRARAEARRTAAALRAAEHAVEVARYELDIARAALEYSAAGERGEAPERILVRSPVDGRVLRVARESAGVVPRGEPLIEVGDPRALEVVAEVLSDDAVRIVPGTRVFFDRWGGARPLEGAVRTVEPSGFTKISALGVEEQRVLIVSDITSPAAEWAQLGDAYRVEARFILWEGDDVLQVPASALFRQGGGWAVFAVDDDRARLRPVAIGRRGALHAQVLEGLREGERVIAHPDDALEEGSRIALH